MVNLTLKDILYTNNEVEIIDFDKISLSQRRGRKDNQNIENIDFEFDKSLPLYFETGIDEEYKE